MGETTTRFGSSDYDWRGTKEVTYPFRLHTNSSVGFDLSASKSYDSSGNATIEAEVLDSSNNVIDKTKYLGSYNRCRLVLPKGDYSFRVKQTAPSSYAGSVWLSANAYTMYDGTNFQVVEPINRDIAHAAEINLEKIVAGSLDNSYLKDYEDRAYAGFSISSPWTSLRTSSLGDSILLERLRFRW